MLDNLVNADLSGLQGHINYSYDSMSQVLPSLFVGIGIFIFLFIIAMVIAGAVKQRKTYTHRKKLVDMYVSGMIRKFAKEEGIDLENEYKLFIKESKKEKLYEKDLDHVVEAELSEKIINENEKKQDKKS